MGVKLVALKNIEENKTPPLKEAAVPPWPELKESGHKFP